MEVIDFMRHLICVRWLCCSLLVALLAETAWSAESGKLTIQPEVLDIGTFYAGGQVTISGEVPAGQDVIVEIAGPVVNGQFDIKGRVGPFWMTSGKAEMDGAPTMYVLLLPGGRDWHRKAASLGLDLERLKSKIAIQSATVPPEELFSMFLELKKNEGLYVVKDNAVVYTDAKNGPRRFTAICRFPRSTAAGNYTIKATAITDGTKGMELSRSFAVDEVGFARLVYDMATNQRLAYGILAVVIALFAGAAMGLLFKGGGGH
jgi:Putative transmembrane protein (Alph_Pro_TM)